MKDIVIIGAGGFAREVVWLIENINRSQKQWNLLGFIDDNENLHGEKLNGYDILGNIDYLNKLKNNIYCIIAIGDGKIRKQIVDRITGNRKFATLIHPDIHISNTNSIGEGCIICCGTILTVNVTLRNHIIINLDCTIGHDAILENYTTLLPSVNVSGNVFIDKYATVGTGANIIQGLHIGKKSIIGAGTVVIRDIENNCTVVGNPARVIKRCDICE